MSTSDGPAHPEPTGPAPSAASGSSGGGVVRRVTTARSWAVWAVGVVAYAMAVFNRTSLGVAAEDASQRFGIGASQLASFAVLQLLVYAAMQVPVGVLLDRYGSRALLVAGGVVMAGGQLLLSQTTTPAGALAARIGVGVGDALTFISVLRIVPAWFAPRQVPVLTQLTGILGQLGQVASAIPLAAVLAGPGWSVAYAGAAAAGLLVALLVLAALRDRPPGAPARPTAPTLAQVGRDLADSWLHPGTRLGLWSHFTVQFSGIFFALLWGFPFMTQGLGLSERVAGSMLTLLVLGGMAGGPVLGRLTATYPLRRSNLVLGVVSATVVVWTAVLLWPGAAPLPLVVLLVLVLSVNGPASLVGFDFARTFNPATRLGSATGIVNVGGFIASLLAILGVGLLLDLRAPAGDYDLHDYKVAFSVQYLLWGVGGIGIWRTRVLARRRLREAGTRIDPLARAIARHWNQRRRPRPPRA